MIFLFDLDFVIVTVKMLLRCFSLFYGHANKAHCCYCCLGGGWREGG